MTTKTATHTPGPWRVVPQSGEYFYEIRGGTIEDSILIAEISEICERDENARLIAAAPEMLDALKVALDELHEVNLAHSYGNRPRNPEMTAAAEVKVRAVIEKARGL